MTRDFIISNETGRVVYQYGVPSNTIGVEAIEVAIRRRGYGTALMDEVFAAHPGAALTNITSMTYDGEDFFEEYVTRNKVPAILHFDTGTEYFNR